MAFDIFVDTSDADRAFMSLAVGLSGQALETVLEGPVSEWFRGRAARRFATGGDDAVGMWEGLSEATQRVREDQGFPGSGPINVRSGELLSFMTDSHGSASPLGDGATLIWPAEGGGDLGEKMRVATEGSPVGANPEFPNSETPPRPVLGIDESDLTAVLTVMSTYIESVLLGGPL